MRNRKIALLIVGVYALSLIASVFTVQPVQAAVAAGYSEYFIPGSTDQLFRIIQDNDNDPQLGNAFGVGTCANNTTECNEMHNVISVSVATNGLKLYYDHWENGYSTGGAGDEIFTANAGDVLIFESGDLRVPRAAANTCTSTNPTGASTRCYDGRDRVYVAGGAVSLSQAFWPEAQNLDTVYSNAWEVYPVKPYQNSYTMPVGEDLVSLGYTDFTHTYLIVQATTDNTTVVIDDPQVAGEQRNVTLNRGAVTDYFHFHTGTTINATAPVQVQFIIGDNWSDISSDTRSYTAVPDGLWSASYFSPVPSFGGAEVDLYIYNPTNSALPVSYRDGAGTGIFSVPARSTRSYQALTGRYVPAGKGVALEAVDKTTKFWTIGSYDTESAQFNYGFTLIPPHQLTNEYFISWAPGTNNDTNNGSPVFVTPVEDGTTVFVDHSPADGVVDISYNLNRVDIAKIRDMQAGDYDNTGMHIWATGPIAVVWGEDAEFSGTSNPYIDAGYTILPLKQEWMESVLTMDKSANPAAVSSEVGSISEFTLLIQGYAYGLDGVWVYDDLPSGWSYVPGSTTITLPGGATITGAGADPAVSGEELTWTNFPSTPLDMEPGEALKIVYQARVDVASGNGYVINESTVTGTVGADTFTASDATTVYMVDMHAAKTSSAGGVVNQGDTITYTVSVNNTGGSTHNDLIITDPLPAGTTYVPQSTKVNYTGAPVVRTYRDEFNTVSYSNSNGTANWSAYPWTEAGPEYTNDPGAGAMLITGNWLRFTGHNTISQLTRSVPMAGAASAVLTFDYRVTTGVLGPEDILNVRVDDGTGFTTVDSFPGNLPAAGTYSRDISSLANANTRIQLYVQSFAGAERLEIDNLQVRYTLPGTLYSRDNIPGGAVADLVSGVPPTMVSAADNIDLLSGSTLTMTYQVRVDQPAAASIRNIVNTAELLSAEIPDPLEPSVSDRLRGVHLMALKTAAPATVPETGSNVTFTYTVTNDGVDPVTINTLVDDRFGSLTGDADCKVGTVLAGSASCSFDAVFYLPAGESGGTHINTFTVTGSDGFGNTGSTSEGETVTYTNVLPDISVMKTASATTVAETGGSVAYTFTVTNHSAEAATITALSDDRFGALSGGPGCSVNTVLPGNTGCSFTASFNIPAGNAGGTHTNTFTVSVRDNEGSTGTAAESETIIYTDVAPDISVTKTAGSLTVPETGGSVTYTFTITNNGTESVTISSLMDDAFGILTGDTDCQTKTVLVGGASCAFDATFVLDAADADETHTNIFTAVALDDEGGSDTASDDATVTYTDVVPQISVLKTASVSEVAETGGDVTFTYTVNNLGTEPAMIAFLYDDPFGDLEGDADCNTTTVLAGATSCSFEATFALPAAEPGGTHMDTFTASIMDNEENFAEASEDETVAYTDVLPEIRVTKTADQTELPETGGDVVFHFLAENTGTEDVTLISLADDVFGDLNGQGTCSVPQTIAVGGSYSCSVTQFLSSDILVDHTNTVTAIAEDNDSSTDEESDSETVTFTDILPDLAVEKTAGVSEVAETGGDVTYTFTVTNNGAERVTITALDDIPFGAMTGDADCQVGTPLAAGESCSFVETFALPAGTVGAAYVNTFSASVQDNDGNSDTETDDAAVQYADALPEIAVTKTASPATLPETGGNATFTFEVVNTGREALTLSDLTDSVYGDLNGQGTCSVPQTILVGGSYTCSITEFLSSDTLANHTNTLTATVGDNDGNTTTGTDGETVAFTDELPVISVTKDVNPVTLPEEGGPATFTYTVTNDSDEAVEITSLVDGTFGTLDGDADCKVGTMLDPGESCSFEATFPISAGDVGDTHVSDFTASAEDNESNTATDTDDATVTYTDTLPAITIAKTADQVNLPETGGDVTFTFEVKNVGLEDVTLTGLVDNMLGDLNGQGTCSVPQTITVGGSYTCQYTTTITGDSLVDHTNTVTADAEDNDGSTATASDSETITFIDVQPAVAISKTANPTSVPETGGAVTFTFVVENTGQEAVTLTSLVDDVFGSLNGQGTCAVPQTIAAGSSYSCSITQVISGDTTAEHANTVTASFGDNDGNSDTASDGAVVTFTNVAPDITVLKTAGVSDVPETGGSVTYTYTVTNAGVEPVTIDSLTDDPFGVLAGDAGCQVGTILAGGESCSFDTTFALPASDYGETHTNTFTAAASDNEGGSDTASDDETVNYTNVEPQVSVLKTASASEIAETGGNVTFTYTVTNLSTEPAMIAFLYDDPFGELEGDADCNTTTTLEGGASCSFEATFTLPAGEPGGTHVDTFTASVMDDEENFAEASEDETVTYTNVLPDVSVLKTAAVTEVVETGENVTFTFTVTNNSLEDAEITALSDDQYGALTGDADCQVGTVLAGSASCSFDAVLAIPAGAVGSTHVNTFTAAVVDNDGGSDSASESETITYTAAPAPAISVLKEVFAEGSWWDANTAPGPEIRYGPNVSFRFTIRNTGNVTLTGISLSDSVYSTAACILPASLSPNDGVDGSGTDQISCIIIAPWTFGQHTNTATASAIYGATSVSDSDDANYVGVNNAADLAVTKTDGVVTYTPGGQLTYTIVVTNNGPDPVTGATFTDAIPAQIARWTWTCVQAGGASGCAGVTNSTANFTNTIDLPVGGSVTYTVAASTRASATTALTNTASVSTPAGTDDTNPGNNSASDVDTAAPRVNLSLTKAVDGQFRAGATLGYTLTVTNNGPSDAANVVLSDTLPDEVTFVSATPAIASGPNPVTWNLGTLASGASRSIRLVVRVKDWVNQPFSNTASVTSSTPDTSVTDNSDTAVADPEEPTPVTLLYFRAAPADGLNVLVEWKAETEVDHFAYKIYRSTTPVFEDAEELTVVGSNAEKTYSYTDTVPTAGNYYYWLVDISTTNAIEVHDPVLIIFNALRFYLPVVGR